MHAFANVAVRFPSNLLAANRDRGGKEPYPAGGMKASFFFPHTYFVLCAFIVLKFPPNHLLSKVSSSSVSGCVSCCVWVTWRARTVLECSRSPGRLERSSVSELRGLQEDPRQLCHQDHRTRFLGSFPPTVRCTVTSSSMKWHSVSKRYTASETTT